MNNFLNWGALNNWTSDKWNWEKELVVITGGSDGFGKLLVQKLATKNVKIIILDIQPPTYELRTHTPLPPPPFPHTNLSPSPSKQQHPLPRPRPRLPHHHHHRHPRNHNHPRPPHDPNPQRRPDKPPHHPPYVQSLIILFTIPSHSQCCHTRSNESIVQTLWRL